MGLMGKGCWDQSKLRQLADMWRDCIEIITCGKFLKFQTKELENVPAVQEVRGSIQKVMDEFAKDHPAVAEDVNKYLGKLKEGTEDVMNKIKAMGDSEESKKVKELSESLLASAQENFTSMANEMKAKFAATSN